MGSAELFSGAAAPLRPAGCLARAAPLAGCWWLGSLVVCCWRSPVKIYELFLRFGLTEAAGMATLLPAMSLMLLILFRRLAHGHNRISGYGR